MSEEQLQLDIDPELIQEDLRELDTDTDEGTDQPESTSGTYVSPHPLGGIQVTTRAVDGNVAISRLDLPEAAILVAHLQALLTMAFETVYMQQAQQVMAAQKEAQENAQKLYVPRR